MDMFITTAQGKRQEQQDRYFCVEQDGWNLLGILDGHPARHASQLSGVAGRDGVEAAELAAEELPGLIFEKLDLGQNLNTLLTQSFEEVDRRIVKSGIESGTTATVVVARDNKIWIANVGDSRAVLVRDGKLERLTVDHVVTNRDELMRYRSSKWFKEKSRLISQRKITGFKLTTLTRSLGDEFFEDALSPVPDVAEVELRDGDRLIVATDGLWHFVGDEEVVEMAGRLGRRELAEGLIVRALENGGSDNAKVGILTT